jgi:uncharacterized membrane protein HdeD (DUF308 family)
MLEERKLYIALGIAIILLGASLLGDKIFTTTDALACAAMGVFVVVNGIRSLRKEKPPVHSGLRTALLLVLTGLALALAVYETLK